MFNEISVICVDDSSCGYWVWCGLAQEKNHTILLKELFKYYEDKICSHDKEFKKYNNGNLL